jgi:Alcohol dehydrogenase GroES-associated
MKAVTWHGRRDVRVEDVPDPRIIEDEIDAPTNEQLIVDFYSKDRRLLLEVEERQPSG